MSRYGIARWERCVMRRPKIAKRIVAIHGSDLFFFVDGVQVHSSVTGSALIGAEDARVADAKEQADVLWNGAGFVVETWA